MLADTTFLIDLLHGKETAIDFLKKNEGKILYTTDINVFELLVGVYVGKRNVESHLHQVNALLTKMFILPLDKKAIESSAKIAAKRIKEGKITEDTDNFIIGIALSNGITQIVTENTKHFEGISNIEVLRYS